MSKRMRVPSPERFEGAGRSRFTSSGRFTPLLIAGLCAIVLGISYESGKGNYHRIRERIAPPPAQMGTPTGPGGEEAIRLHRDPSAVGGLPEFVSATLLPGRGMNVFQLTAMVPGHGEVPLLVSPPLADAAAQMNGAGPDANGALSTSFGGAFLVPWAGRASGKPAGAPGVLQTSYMGSRLTFPSAQPSGLLSTEGLLLARAADTNKTDVLLDRQSAEAVFHTGSFSGNWPSTADVRVTADMSGRVLDLTVVVQNTGGTAMPAAVGWKPYFAIPSGERSNVELVLPSDQRLETDRSTGQPTGRVLPTGGTALDFDRARGTRLGNTAIDDTFVHLITPVLAQGPTAEIRDVAYGFGIRILPLTPNIRAIRVVAPTDKPWISIEPDMNVGDPFGPQWSGPEASGMQILKPGESLTWKVRVELFTFPAGQGGGS